MSKGHLKGARGSSEFHLPGKWCSLLNQTLKDTEVLGVLGVLGRGGTHHRWFKTALGDAAEDQPARTCWAFKDTATLH